MSTTEKTYEMMWDCEYCGQKKLLGLTQRFCANCGAAQNPQKRYFPPDNEKVAVQDHPYVGADVACPACRQPMSRAANACTNCGSPLAEGKQVAMQQAQTRGPHELLGASGVEVQGAQGQWQAPPAAGQTAPKKRKVPIWAFVVGGLVLLIGTCVALRSMERSAVVTAARHEWTRSIAVERYDEVHKHGACSSVPGNGHILSRHQGEPHCTTKRVDKGDGTFAEKKECSEAVEECDYTVDEWHVVKTESDKGGLDKSPVWPAVHVTSCASRGCEREGARTEKYTIYFDETGGKGAKAMSCDYQQAAWRGIADGAQFHGKIHSVGGDLDCGTLKKK